MLVLFPRSCDNHSIAVGLCKSQVAGKGLALVEILEHTNDFTHIATLFVLKIKTLVLVHNVALIGC